MLQVALNAYFALFALFFALLFARAVYTDMYTALHFEHTVQATSNTLIKTTTNANDTSI